MTASWPPGRSRSIASESSPGPPNRSFRAASTPSRIRSRRGRLSRLRRRPPHDRNAAGNFHHTAKKGVVRRGSLGVWEYGGAELLVILRHHTPTHPLPHTAFPEECPS